MKGTSCPDDRDRRLEVPTFRALGNRAWVMHFLRVLIDGFFSNLILNVKVSAKFHEDF